MDASLEIAYKNIVYEKDFILSIKTYFINRLKEEIPRIEFNGCSDDFSKSTYTLVNVCLPVAQEKAPLFLFQLDLKGIACSKGSACQSGGTAESHVLNEVLSEVNLKKPSIRFSFSCFNTTKEIDTVVHTLKALVLEST